MLKGTNSRGVRSVNSEDIIKSQPSLVVDIPPTGRCVPLTSTAAAAVLQTLRKKTL